MTWYEANISFSQNDIWLIILGHLQWIKRLQKCSLYRADQDGCLFFFYSLISPLHYCADYRPFFTIHDTEFKEYTTRTQAP